MPRRHRGVDQRVFCVRHVAGSLVALVALHVPARVALGDVPAPDALRVHRGQHRDHAVPVDLALAHVQEPADVARLHVVGVAVAGRVEEVLQRVERAEVVLLRPRREARQHLELVPLEALRQRRAFRHRDRFHLVRQPGVHRRFFAVPDRRPVRVRHPPRLAVRRPVVVRPVVQLDELRQVPIRLTRPCHRSSPETVRGPRADTSRARGCGT